MSSGELLNYITVGGIAIFAISTIISQWKNGTSKVSAEALAVYKTREEQRDKEVENLHADIKDLTAQLNILQGVVKEKDDRIKSLEAVLQGRDPEMQAFMKKLNMSTDLFTTSWPTIEAILKEYHAAHMTHP